jgi:hypothetical protein
MIGDFENLISRNFRDDGILMLSIKLDHFVDSWERPEAILLLELEENV